MIIPFSKSEESWLETFRSHPDSNVWGQQLEEEVTDFLTEAIRAYIESGCKIEIIKSRFAAFADKFVQLFTVWIDEMHDMTKKSASVAAEELKLTGKTMHAEDLKGNLEDMEAAKTLLRRLGAEPTERVS
jgi:hypothetical protein